MKYIHYIEEFSHDSQSHVEMLSFRKKVVVLDLFSRSCIQPQPEWLLLMWNLQRYLSQISVMTVSSHFYVQLTHKLISFKSFIILAFMYSSVIHFKFDSTYCGVKLEVPCCLYGCLVVSHLWEASSFSHWIYLVPLSNISFLKNCIVEYP